MVFAGNISELSAKYMLNRYLSYIEIPKIDLKIEKDEWVSNEILEE